MRLLERTRPKVHVLHVVMVAFESERPFLGPRAHDQVVRLMEAVVRESRVHAERVVFRADAAHEAADQATAADDVDHRVLFSDRQRVRAQGQCAAKNSDLHLLRFTRQGRSRDNRRRHEAVGSLMVLVHPDRVEAQFLCVLELVEVPVVELVTLDRIEVLVRQIDPDGAVLAPRLEVEVGVRHEVK